MWTLYDACKDIVNQSWNTNVVGCHMHILSQKLKLLKTNLKVWNREVIGNIHENVSEAENNLQAIHEKIDTYGHTETLLNQQKAAQITLENVMDKQEAFWREKAKVKWHLEGDRNTSYFHRIAKIINMMNT